MRKSIRLSQNFLANQPLIEQLVSRAGFSSSDTVLDIGAGSGSITRALAGYTGHVIAYEADERLATELVGKFLANPNVQIIMGDFLMADLPLSTYKVFANIPFNKTSDIVHKLLDGFNPPIGSHLVIQQEAAMKFAGVAKKQSLFSILHSPWFEMNIIYEFKPGDFTPRPAVKIVLLHIKQRVNPLVLASEAELYRDFVSYVFNHANPNILPSLKLLFPAKSFAAVERALGSKVASKPSQLEPHDWLAMFRAFMSTAQERQRQLVTGAALKQRQEAAHIEKHHRTRLSKFWRQESKKSKG